MSRGWRWFLVVAIAATVLGGFMPQALLRDARTPAAESVLAVAGPPTFPSGCAGASCARSAPAVPAPVLTIAALAASLAVVLCAAFGGAARRVRSRLPALPRGTPMVLFRPPQFS
jgi:hypothetical protein